MPISRQVVFACLLAALAAANAAAKLGRHRRQNNDNADNNNDEPSFPPPQDFKNPSSSSSSSDSFAENKDSNVDIATLDTIAKLVSSTPEFSLLAAALVKAGLMDTLAGGGPFTVFAPNNAAFEAMPPATLARLMGNTRWLKEVLLRHVLSQNVEVSAQA